MRRRHLILEAAALVGAGLTHSRRVLAADPPSLKIAVQQTRSGKTGTTRWLNAVADEALCLPSELRFELRAQPGRFLFVFRLHSDNQFTRHTVELDPKNPGNASCVVGLARSRTDTSKPKAKDGIYIASSSRELTDAELQILATTLNDGKLRLGPPKKDEISDQGFALIDKGSRTEGPNWASIDEVGGSAAMLFKFQRDKCEAPQ